MKNKFLFVVISAVLLLHPLFFSCKNPPIFAAIEQEVKLKPASVQGVIVGIVKAGDTVYAANPKTVFHKKIGEKGKWEEIDIPSSWCTSIVSDGEKLYASFSGGAYFYQQGSWHSIQGGTDIVKFAGSTPITGVDSSGVLYKINGGKAEKIKEKLDGTFLAGAGNFFITTAKIYSASDGKEIKGSGVPDSGFRTICSGSGCVFIITSSKLFCAEPKEGGIVWSSISHEVSNPLCAAYLSSKSILLIGGEKGYGEIKLPKKNSLADAEITSPGSGISTTPPRCYHQYNNSIGKWLVRPLCALENGSGYIIYAGIGGSTPKYTGLWGFYNPGQMEWNRE